MASDKQIISKLNELRSAEQRMSLVYRRAAQMVTGPYREALVDELQEHADEETEHADGLMRQIVAMGGDIGEDVKQIPVWRTLDDVLSGLLELEEEGIKNYQELRRMLPEDDPFRFYVESTMELELEHQQDVKRWLRRDYAEKSMSDHGSPKPLNWREPDFIIPMRKSASWEERADVYNRFGSPPIRRGSVHGSLPDLIPALPPEMNPPLFLEKAVRQPQDPTSSRPQFSRKRDSSGQFVESQQAGTESTAAEDAENLTRESKLRSAKQRKQQRPDWAPAQAGKVAQRQAGKMGKAVPGAQTAVTDNAIAGASANQPESEPIAETPSGKLIYDDPYHPEHDSLTPEEHQYAMQYHQEMADASATSGDHERSMQCQQKASAHEEMMQNTQSPMDRAANQVPGQNAPPQQPMPGQPGLNKALNYSYQPDNLNEFLAPHDQAKPSFGGPNEGPAPGMINTNTGTPVGPQTDVGAPLPQDMGSPMDPMMQSPIMTPAPPAMPGMDPMAQQPPPMDPMMQQPPMDPMMQPPMDPMMGQQPPMDPMMAQQPPMDPMMQQQQAPPPMDPMMQQQPPMGQQPPPPTEPGMAPPPTGMDPGGGEGTMEASAGEGQSFDDLLGYTEVSDQGEPGIGDASGPPEEGAGGPPGTEGGPTEPSQTDAPQQEAGADQMNDNGPPQPPNGEDKEETKGSPSDVAPFGGNAKDDRADEEGKPQFMKSLKDWRRRNV